MSQCEIIARIHRSLAGRRIATCRQRSGASPCRQVVADCDAARQRLEKIQAHPRHYLAAEAARLEFAPFWREVQHRIEAKRPWHGELIEAVQSLFSAAASRLGGAGGDHASAGFLIASQMAGWRSKQATTHRWSRSTPMVATSRFYARTKPRRRSFGFIKIQKVKTRMSKKLRNPVLLFSLGFFSCRRLAACRG